MKNSRFIKIFATFSKEEIKRFGKFLNSPYFNTNKTIVKLYSYLKRHHKSLAYLNENIIHKHLYPAQSFKQKRIRVNSSEILHLCESFIAIETLNKDYFSYRLNILKNLNSRNVPNTFIFINNSTESLLLKNKYYHDYFTDTNLLNKELVKFYNTYDIYKLKNILPSLMNNTLLASLYEILRCYLGITAICLPLNTTCDLTGYKEIMSLIKSNIFFKDPLIEIYYYLNILSKGKKHKVYNKIKSILKNNKANLNNEIKKEMYLTLHNYLIYKESVSSNPSRFEIERYQIMKEMYENNLMKDNNDIILPSYIFSYSLLLIHLTKYSEARSFLDKAKNDLETFELYSNDIFYLYAKLFFEQNDFKRALNEADKVDNSNMETKIYTKIIQIICLYELGNYDTLSKLLISFRGLLKRNSSQLIFFKLDSFLLFAKYSEQLIKNYSVSDVNNLYKEISNLEPFIYRKWILKKLELLQKS